MLKQRTAVIGKASKCGLVLLAIVFTLALTFATLELPSLLNSLLLGYFPDSGLGIDSSFMNYERPIGYACLGIVIALIVVGFKTGRSRLSSLGSFALFLPTFGYFALSMFLLAGIGILRVIWLPVWDSSWSFLKLGDIAYLPYMIVVYPFYLLKVDVRASFASLAVGAGLLIFFLGTVTWLYGKFERKELIDFWIYRYSRHPQYLGYLIWSYGVMLLASLYGMLGTKLIFAPGPSLPWLISSLIVICIALTEEIHMRKTYGESYLKYQGSTPFMLPLPKVVSSVTTAPIRILFKSNLPKNGKEILYTFVIYSVILVLLSLPFLILNWPPDSYGWITWPS
jgi:protein-S-isoprenylcysteine O-methyltransferase Ste14